MKKKFGQKNFWSEKVLVRKIFCRKKVLFGKKIWSERSKPIIACWPLFCLLDYSSDWVEMMFHMPRVNMPRDNMPRVLYATSDNMHRELIRPRHYLPPVTTRPGRQYAPVQYAPGIICHLRQYAPGQYAPVIICHLRQYAPMRTTLAGRRRGRTGQTS